MAVEIRKAQAVPGACPFVAGVPRTRAITSAGEASHETTMTVNVDLEHDCLWQIRRLKAVTLQ